MEWNLLTSPTWNQREKGAERNIDLAVSEPHNISIILATEHMSGHENNIGLPFHKAQSQYVAGGSMHIVGPVFHGEASCFISKIGVHRISDVCPSISKYFWHKTNFHLIK